MARPTKVQQLINKIEKNKNLINESAADAMLDMYSIIEATARDSKATHASRMAAAKYVIECAEDFLKEDASSEEEDASETSTASQGMPISSSIRR